MAAAAAAARPHWPAFAGRFDISEREEAFELVADAPGFDPSDIVVEVEKGVLTISAKHEERKEQQPQQTKEQEKHQEERQEQQQQQELQGQKQPQEQQEMEQSQGQQQEEHPEQWSFVEAPKAGNAEAQPDEQQAELNSQQDHGGAHAVKGQQLSGSSITGVEQVGTRSEPSVSSQFWRRERHVQQFVRRFKLPDEAKADAIVARLDKGVLTVTVPKLPPAPKPQARRIQVQG